MIGRKEMVCLFASMLRKDDDGGYWLVSPDEKGAITVEDVPFLAVELFADGAGREQVVSFRTNVDDVFSLDGGHPLRIGLCPQTGEPVPYVLVRDGLEARLTRPVYYELVALGFEDIIDGERLYGLWSNHTFFVLGSPDDPD